VTVCDHPLIYVTFSVSPKNCFESAMFLWWRLDGVD